MNIVQNISKIAKNKGITLTEIERKCGFSKSSMRKWSENIPSMEKIIKVADLLNVSLDYIVFGDEREEALTQLDGEERELLSNYRKSSIIDKARIQERALVSAEHAKAERAPTYAIKLFSVSVSAGTGIYVDYTDSEKIEIREDPEGADYAVRVSGDSMEPVYHNGDIVLVELAQTVQLGEIGIFNLNGQAYIKKLGKNKLLSLNPEYPPIEYSLGDNCVCQGRVIRALKERV